MFTVGAVVILLHTLTFPAPLLLILQLYENNRTFVTEPAHDDQSELQDQVSCTNYVLLVK